MAASYTPVIILLRFIGDKTSPLDVGISIISIQQTLPATARKLRPFNNFTDLLCFIRDRN